MNEFTPEEVLERGADPGINIKKHLLNLLKRWPYIISFFLLAVAIGYSINRYSTPIYLVKARITTKKFNDKQANPVPGLIDASFFLSGLIEAYEEIPILKSTKRIAAALNRVDFRISYYAKGWIKTIESENGMGFTVMIDSLTEENYPHSIPIFVNRLSDKFYELSIEGNKTWQDIVAHQQFRFGEPVRLGSSVIRIINTQGNTGDHDKFYFVFNRSSDLVTRYSQRLNVNWAVQGSAMLDIQMLSELPNRDLKFMNAYYEVVEEMGLTEKNELLNNTIRFIDEQMKMVNDSLDYYQGLLNDLRLDNRKMPLGTESVFNRMNELDGSKANILLEERYFDYLIDYFKSNRQAEVFAPSLIGLHVPLVEKWVSVYIEKKLSEKKSIVSEANAQNPLINRMDSVDSRLERSIYEAIRSARQLNRLKLKEVDQQFSMFYSSIDNVQANSRNMSRHERLYQINNTLFDLFVRRKAEAAISKASATSDYKVINPPDFSGSPVSPDTKNNLMMAALLGLLLPIGFFLVRDITNGFIMDRDDLQHSLHIPVLGNVAHNGYDTRLIVKTHPRSVVAESFRAVRANLKFLVRDSSARAHTFVITSTIGGEGKTFCSINLGYSLANSQKKTIVIGADLRKPELANYLQIPAEKGLSAYLAGYATLEEIIVVGKEHEPDFIEAGKIPPNPSELLAHPRMAALMTFLKERYDYILIDTAPIGLVSDAMELFKYSDYNILIVRRGVTPKAALRMIDELYQDGRLPHFTTLFNDLELISKRNSYYGGYLYGMGYSGYGYGYYEEDKGKGKS